MLPLLFLRFQDVIFPNAMPHNLRQARHGLANLDFVIHQHGIVNSIRKVYAFGQMRFLDFCQHFTLKPFPASETLFCCFVAFLAESGVSYGLVHSYLAEVRYLHIMCGHSDPSLLPSPRLGYMLKGLRQTGLVRP